MDVTSASEEKVEQAAPKRQSRAILECPVCLHGYNSTDRKPYALSCNHSFCSECIDTLEVQQSTLSCPKCQRKTPVDLNQVSGRGLEPNYDLVDLLKMLELQDPSAKVASSTAGGDDLDTCPDHEISAFCTTCSLPHCEDASCSFLVKHSDHESQPLVAAATSARAELSSMMALLESNKQSLESSAGKASALTQSLEDTAAKLTAEAKEHMDSLIAAISQRTEQLCRDIQAATQKKIIELRTYHNAVEVALQKSIAATKSAQELVGRDDFSVAAHKARVEAQLQSARHSAEKAQNSSVLETSESKISLSFSSLHKTLQSHGKLVVSGGVVKNSPSVPSALPASPSVTKFGTGTYAMLPNGATPHPGNVAKQDASVTPSAPDAGDVIDGEFDVEIPVGAPGAQEQKKFIVVADTRNHRIQLFSFDGLFQRAFGKKGKGPCEFNQPTDVHVTKDYRILVADKYNHRVQVLSWAGEFLLQLGTGKHGTDVGHLTHPAGVATDSKGNIIVGEAGGDRVSVFNEDGDFLYTFGKSGSGDGQFINISGICVDEEDRIIVVDGDTHQVQVFTLTGQLLGRFPGSTGSQPGMLSEPSGVCSTGGKIMVADSDNHRLQCFNIQGACLFVLGKKGKGGGQFNQPHGVDADELGNVVVADRNNNRVQVFDKHGMVSHTFGSRGKNAGFFERPEAAVFVLH